MKPFYSNCWWWAIRRKRSIERTFHCGPGYEVYTIRRRGRYISWVPHWLIGMRNTATGHVSVRSFVPLEPREHALWELPLLLWHRGRIVAGDEWLHETVKPLPKWKRAVSGALMFAAGLWLGRWIAA